MILAHGSGLDDTAFVVLPFLVFAALRWLNRRQSAQQDVARDTRQVTRNNADSS